MVFALNTGTAITDNSNSSNNQLDNYSSIAIRDGDSVLANCITGLGPNSSSSNSVLGGWYFNGNQLPNQVCTGNGVKVLDNIYAGVFQLQQCGLPTEGDYTCIILDNAMVQQITMMSLTLYYTSRSKYGNITHIYNHHNICILWFSLNVAAPEIYSPSSPTNMVQVIGSTLRLSCYSRGSQPDAFTWMKDGVPITQSVSITTIAFTSTTAKFRSCYTISGLNTSDIGTYTCTVTNNLGSDNQTINVTVIGMVNVHTYILHTHIT